MGLNPEDARRYREETEKTKRTLDGNLESLLSLADAQRDILFFTRDYASEVKKASKALNINSITASETAKAFQDVTKAAKGITDSYMSVISGEKKLEEIQKNKLKLYNATNSLQTEYEQFLQSVLGDEKAINDVLEGRVLLEDALIDSAEKGIISEDDLQAALDLGNIFAGINLELEAERANMEEIERRAKNIEDALNFGGGIGLGDVADAFGNIVGEIGGSDFAKKLGIGDAVSESRKFAATLTESGDKAAGLGDKFKVAQNLAGNIGKNLMKSLGPAALLAMAVEKLIEAFKFIDSTSGELAKEFAISAEEGQKLVKSANQAAAASGDLLVSTKDVVAAQQALNKEFGTAVEFSGEFAAEFASIQERTKLSGEAMGFFASNALVAGGNIKDQLADVNAITMELNEQTGVNLNIKNIQEGLAKTSKAALLTAGRNTKELANQVYQAKLLGVEQSKIEGISESLLNFEDSIAKELEAELLLGRDINLERARAAALEGDLATVASEVNKQLEDGKDFSELNVIQQKALADSVGMTREELAAALVEQENLAAVQAAGFESMSDAQKEFNRLRAEGLTAEEAAKAIGDASLANQLESASAAEKMQAAQEKIQDLFVAIMGSLMPIFNILIDIIETAINPLVEALNPILTLFGELLNAILKPIVRVLKETFLPPIMEIIKAVDQIKIAFADIFGEAEEGGGVFEAIGEIIGVALLIPLRGIQFVVNNVKNMIQGWSDIFGGLADIMEGDILGGFIKIGKGITRILISPFQAMLDVAIATINALIRAVNKIPGVDIDEFGDVDIADSIFGKEEEDTSTSTSTEAPSPTIGLATGGIVTAPTTALIGEGGEPEAVVPLSKAQSMGFGGNEKTIELLERLVAAVEKGGIVELDGNKVGTVLGLSSYKTQ